MKMIFRKRIGMIIASTVATIAISVAAYAKPTLSYSAHVNTDGWLKSVYSNTITGKLNKPGRMEAVKIWLQKDTGGSGITYRAHVMGKGWLPWKNSGDIAGTVGEYRQMEAIQIQLTNGLQDFYDIQYRARCEKVGWTSWVSNGAVAGTTGRALRMEAIQIKLIDKAGSNYRVINAKNGLRLREGKSTSTRNLVTIPNGTVVKVISCNNGWAATIYKDKLGYCSTDYLRKEGASTSSGNTSSNSGLQGNKLTRNGVEYIVAKNYSSAYVYKQGYRQCTKCAGDIVLSMYNGTRYQKTGWSSGGCTWKESGTGKTIYKVGLENATAQEKLNRAGLLISNGVPSVLRLGSNTGHSVAVVGIRKTANLNSVGLSDLLIADPGNASIRTLQEMKNSGTSTWYGGIKSKNTWGLYIPFETPANLTSGFRNR